MSHFHGDLFGFSLNKTLLHTHTHIHCGESLERLQIILQFCAFSAPETSETVEDIVGSQQDVDIHAYVQYLVSASLQSGFNIFASGFTQGHLSHSHIFPSWA